MSDAVPSLRAKVITWLKEQVPDARLQHILRVEGMAMELAQQHDLDTSMAAQAGLMHDLAKYFKAKRLLAMAQAEGLTLDPVDVVNPHLLHAEVSAIVARDVFGVSHPQILAAIRNHTLGRPGMDALSCVVFLADSLEPGRGNTPELQDLRRLCVTDLSAAVYHTCEYSLRSLMEKRHLIHPQTIATRNWFLQASRGKTLNLPDPAYVSA